LRQGRWKKELYLRVLERRNLLGAAAVQAVSEPERRAIERLRLPARLVTVPLGVDVPMRGPRQSHRGSNGSAGDGAVKVLFLSRIHPKKGLELLLEAMELLPKETAVDLVVAGDGEPEYVSGLRQRAAASRANGRVTFAGFVAGEEKRRLLEEADLFVLPSHDENFGVAVAEALGAGLPVIVSEHVALADQTARAGAGLVVPCDAGALAQALATLIGDPGRRDRMGEAGRTLAGEFSWPMVGRQLLALYGAVRTHDVPSPREPAEAFRG
jgi:glycosyltransferase involved in cell wall biosynthesis